jgi:hypothetical protein
MTSHRAQHVVVAWYCQFGMDLLVLVLTITRTWTFPRKGDGLPQIIRRDGASYFL